MSPIPDFEALRQEIVSYHKGLIDAHLEKNVDFLADGLSEGFLSVSADEIRRPTVEEVREKLEKYLRNTTLTEYRSVCEPIVNLSQDGSMAWSVAQVKVAGTRRAEDGSLRTLDFVCAWVTVFERRDDRWVRLAEVSTFA
jgi:hypothetical protein